MGENAQEEGPVVVAVVLADGVIDVIQQLVGRTVVDDHPLVAHHFEQVLQAPPVRVRAGAVKAPPAVVPLVDDEGHAGLLGVAGAPRRRRHGAGRNRLRCKAALLAGSKSANRRQPRPDRHSAGLVYKKTLRKSKETSNNGRAVLRTEAQMGSPVKSQVTFTI